MASEVVLVDIEVVAAPRPVEVVELLTAGMGVDGVCAETGKMVKSTTAIGRPNSNTRRWFISNDTQISGAY